MIRAVAALAAAALLLTADPAAAIGGSAGAVIGGRAAAGTGSPNSAAISAAAGQRAAARNALVGGQGAAATQPVRRTELTLSYMADNGPATAVVLRCHPAGGTHPKKVKACRLLTKIHGDPDRLRPAALMCTLEYAPVTAQIKGGWQGRRVDWSRRFGNRCDMRRTTGALMEF